MSFWEFANPSKFMQWSGRLLPVLSILAAFSLICALIWGFFFTSDDMKQGSTVKILYVHVPAAFLAINCWLAMFAGSLIWLIRRHHVSALAARAAAPIGAVMTLMAILTGAFWGQPMWGTYWEWDPRLTSFLILFLFYIGYIALWYAVDNPDNAADLTSILCMVGSVFAVLSRYAAMFWAQGLHQGSSLSVDRETHIHNDYYWPLLLSLAGFILLFLALMLLRTRSEVMARRIRALELRGVSDHA